MAQTIGVSNVRHLVNLFDATVSSIYRYGLGVWGVSCAQVTKLDDLFVEFMRWLFKLPPKTGKMALLACFARRCAKCDAIFLAATQIAQAAGTRNRNWAEVVQDLKTGVLSSQWYDIVTAETDRRGLLSEILERGKEFVSNRREYGVVFAQFCFHAHTNALTGSSADLVKLSKKFGVLPFLFVCHPEQSRFLLSFLLSCWRYTDACRCINYPAICETCDQENSSVHILFECVLFCLLREEFEEETGQSFSFALLESEDLDVCRLSVRLGKDLFEAVAELCEI